MKTYQRERRGMGFRYVAQPPACKSLQSTTNRVLLTASERDRRSRGTSCFIFITFLIDVLVPGWIFTSYKRMVGSHLYITCDSRCPSENFSGFEYTWSVSVTIVAVTNILFCNKFYQPIRTYAKLKFAGAPRSLISPGWLDWVSHCQRPLMELSNIVGT